MKNRSLGLGSVGLVCALLAACGGGGGDGSFESGTGRLSLGVTDAPIDDAEAVVVTFTGIELLDAQGRIAESFPLNPPRSIDLLRLQGDRQAFLIDDVALPAGVYDEVRLIVDTENASCNNLVAPFSSFVTIDGTDFPLIVPSGGSSGFKVKGPLTIAAGNRVAYTIDFDLRRSIAQRGATGCYNLRPVLRVVDNAEIGTLAGRIDGALLADSRCSADPLSGRGAAVYVFSGPSVRPDDLDDDDDDDGPGGDDDDDDDRGDGDHDGDRGPFATALLVPRSDGDFDYEVGFLLTGRYTVALACSAGEDDPDDDDDDASFIGIVNVTIESDEVTELDFPVGPL